MRSRGRSIRAVLSILLVLVIVFLLGRGLWKNWRQIPFDRLHFNYLFIILSFVSMFAFFSVYAFSWRSIVRSYGFRVRFADSFQILAVSNLGKYVPGKVWFALGRMYLAKKVGVPERVAIVSMFLETSLLAVSAGMIALSTIAAPWQQSFSRGTSLIVLAVIALGLCVVHPRVFTRLVNAFLKKLKRSEIQMGISYGGITGLLVLYCLSWLCQGVGFFLMVESFYDIELSLFPFLLGTYALAWITGFLNLLTPAGIGVREGVITFFLSFWMPTSMAVIVALITRVWSTLVDLAFFGSSLPGARKWRQKRDGGYPI